MPALELAQRALWIVTTLAELAVVWMLLRKSLYRQFPCFFCYVLWQVVRDVFFAPLSFQHPVLYFYVYWYAEAASAILGICVVFETYRQVLKDYESLQHIGRVLFRWVCVLLLAVTVVVALAADGSENIRLVATILALERSIRFLQAGLLAFLFVFSRSLGLNWRQFVFGLTAGMALYVGAELIVVTIRNHFGRSFDDAFTTLKPAAFLCAVCIWLTYLVVPRRALVAMSSPLGQVEELGRWSSALESHLQ